MRLWSSRHQQNGRMNSPVIVPEIVRFMQHAIDIKLKSRRCDSDAIWIIKISEKLVNHHHIIKHGTVRNTDAWDAPFKDFMNSGLSFNCLDDCWFLSIRKNESSDPIHIICKNINSIIRDSSLRRLSRSR